MVSIQHGKARDEMIRFEHGNFWQMQYSKEVHYNSVQYSMYEKYSTVDTI